MYGWGYWEGIRTIIRQQGQLLCSFVGFMNISGHNRVINIDTISPISYFARHYIKLCKYTKNRNNRLKKDFVYSRMGLLKNMYLHKYKEQQNGN